MNHEIEFSGDTIKDLKLFELIYPFTKNDLKKKYRDLVMQYHPDKHPEIQEDKIKTINVAFKNLSKIALEKIDVKISLSEELKKKYKLEEEDIFTLYNPCPECNGSRVTYKIITVSKTCSNCGGTGKVKLKCKFCDNGTYTTKSGYKIPCRRCNGTGIWREVFCNKCSSSYKNNWGDLLRNMINDYWDFGTTYEEKKIEQVCTNCQGRGKIKYEPSNPVIKKGAILRMKNKKK